MTNATNDTAISVSPGYPLLRCGCPSSTGVTFTTYNGATCPACGGLERGTLCHRQNAGHIQCVNSLRPVLRGQRHPYSYRGIDGAHPMKLKQIRDDTRGAVIVEFTVTVAFFLLLTFGLVQAGLLLWTQAGLQHGVEYAARCASVNYSAKQMGLNTSCFGVDPTTVTNDTIKQYALDHSFGLVPVLSAGLTVTPTPATSRCLPDGISAMLVTASAPYNLINYIFSVTLTATSKFPINCS